MARCRSLANENAEAIDGQCRQRLPFCVKFVMVERIGFRPSRPARCHQRDAFCGCRQHDICLLIEVSERSGKPISSIIECVERDATPQVEFTLL